MVSPWVTRHRYGYGLGTGTKRLTPEENLYLWCGYGFSWVQVRVLPKVPMGYLCSSLSSTMMLTIVKTVMGLMFRVRGSMTVLDKCHVCHVTWSCGACD